MRNRLFSVAKSLIGLPLTILSLFFIFKIILAQLPTLTISIHTIHISLLIFGIICFIIFYFLRSFIWHQILTSFDYSLSFKETSYLWALSELKRYIPGNVWAFLGRTVLFNNKGVQKKDIAKGLIFEAELFIIGCAIISLLSLPFYFSKEQTIFSWLITGVITVLTIVYCCQEYFKKYISTKISRFVSYILPFPSIETTIFLVWISIIAVFLFGLGNYLVISSVIYLTPKLFLELIGVFDFAFVIGDRKSVV